MNSKYNISLALLGILRSVGNTISNISMASYKVGNVIEGKPM